MPSAPVRGARSGDLNFPMTSTLTRSDPTRLAQRFPWELQADSPDAGKSRGKDDLNFVLPSTHQLTGSWDRVDLERVLANLYDNALKYSPAGRQVVVTLGQDGGWAIVRVDDQGFGIPSPDLPHVFDPGYRASNVAGLAPGSGIGLATVQRIVHRLGVKISIQSLQGLGTTVTVRLPIRRERSSIA
jgi:signal transduction histidine kinase